MKKNYIAPSMKVREIDMESNLLGNSPATINKAKPFSGLQVFSGDEAVEYGGTATNGSAGDAGAKFGNVWESWGGDEEE